MSQEFTQQAATKFRELSDPEWIKNADKYFTTSMEYLGIKTPVMRELIKEWWDELKKLPPLELIELAKNLVDTRVFECNQLAFELLWKNKSALDSLTLPDLEYLGKNMDNWATTDTFSVMLSGWAWRKGQIKDADILNWLKTRDRWWRRAAVVSTVGLNLKSRGGTGDTKRTVMVCEKVIEDRDDMMVKALSWALRELSKTDKKAVEEFMGKYEEKLSGRVKREVYTKLTTGKKN